MFSRSSIQHANTVEIDPSTIRLIENRPPIYPIACIRGRIQGDVVVNYLLDEKGRILKWKVVHRDHPGLEAAVLVVAPHWNFMPVLHNGKPVQAAFDLTFRFTLEVR